MEQLIAHLTNGKEQSLTDHLNNVGELCELFASKFGFGHIGKLIGQIHDIGKSTEEFQSYIRGLYNGHPVHALYGGKYLQELYPELQDMSNFIENVIIGHHRGLYNKDDIEQLYSKHSINTKDLTFKCHKEAIDFISPMAKVLSSPWLKALKESNEMSIKGIEKGKYAQIYINHVFRMLFSCLVDADWLDTEKFCDPERHARRMVKKSSMTELNDKLDRYIAENFASPTTYINKVRTEIRERCEKQAPCSKGFYSLVAPTGAGKTITSISWALKHAVHNGCERVIIVIPFKTIISQTVNIYENIFGKDNVLIHYSDNDFSMTGDESEDEITLRRQMQTENWDAPIVITTNVQFLESLRSGSRARCRKLHNICNSVVVMDEVQTGILNTKAQSILHDLRAYHELFGASFLFMSATMPILQSYRSQNLNGELLLHGLDSIKSVLTDSNKYYEALNRIELHETDFDTEADAVEAMMKHEKVLCIVNTRKIAALLYKEASQLADREVYHLSRNMTQCDIDATLEQIKKALKTDKKIMVISTQLIEAGVDLDFPVVFRQEIGIDSIVQAAGRCNREGKLEKGHTYIFSLKNHPIESKKINQPKGKEGKQINYMSYSNSARKEIVWDLIVNEENMNRYYKNLYNKVFFSQNNLEDTKTLCNFAYERTNEEYRLIDDSSISILIPDDEIEDDIKKIRYCQFIPSSDIRYKINKHIVNVAKWFKEKELDKNNSLIPLYDGSDIFLLVDKTMYNKQVGLTKESSERETEIFIV